MNYLPLLLVVVLLLAVASGSSAEKYFYDAGPGDMRVSFNPGADGMSVTYKGVSIVRESSFWVHNPGWNFHYYGYPQAADAVQIKQIEGGIEATSPHHSEWFDGQQRFTVKGNSVSVEFKYKLIKDVKDADVEYCFGRICAAPILGRPFNAVMMDGSTKEGIVPARATDREFSKTILTPQPFKKMNIDSRIGRMTIEFLGDTGGANMMDYRLSHYEAIDKQPVFWTGILGHHMDYGKEYTQTITLTIDPLPSKPEVAQAPVVQVMAKSKPDVRAPFAGPVYVIPEPQQMELSKDDFQLTGNTKIVIGDKAEIQDTWGAKSFAEEMQILYGFKPQIIRQKQVKRTDSVILVGESFPRNLLSSTPELAKIVAPNKEEGYALVVTPKRVIVLGHDRKGTYYGMQTLKQLTKAAHKGALIQGCTINDWPSLAYRGAHLFTGNEALPFHKKLIDRILARYKMNNLVLQVDQIKWKSDPTIAVGYSEEHEDVKKELDYAGEHFMEVNPLLQSLGHCDWLFKNDRNLDMAENPNVRYAYCPSNPRVYDYMFKLYDETIKLFNNPKYIHIGHDEVSEPGGFPRHEECKKRTAEQIFVDDTLKVRNHIAKSGASAMMWGDMLLAKGDSPDATNAETPERAKWIRDQLPKDTIITDWHYAADKPESYKSLDVLQKEGFKTIAATWYTPENIEAFSKQAKNVGALGLLQTTWAGFNSNENNLNENFIQFSAMILAAEYAWNSGKTDLEHLPYKVEEEFRRQWNPKPIDKTVRAGMTIDLTSAYNISLADNNEKTGWLGLGPQQDLSAVPTGEVRLWGDLFLLAPDNTKPSAIRLMSALDADKAYPEKVEIAVGKKASALLFLHTSAWTDRSGNKVGAYKVNYADGSSVEIPLIYGVNITSWIDLRSVKDATLAWKGRTRDDQKVELTKMQWDNPAPDKVIKSLELISSGAEAGPVLVAVSTIK